ncbi:CDP-alcohol phosphatidyltransferase [Desulfuribacillus stibiiarsenatis]|uniref:CDP-alcohol phosphatidyltransferase n=1 Tax=Desulfuribacillus stibiiarsenatis TaxID=1390249 RepID=A0A1E5L4T0_9FIRM|nr:CDP-alcohol phosphatidyltransferase family protein [Desulfuribacillus stibiiarsenatis]OEH84979.1 CDP-alcohol phosphatidyltransferase [Desulfuribacillus stibiiarsenatis]
MLDTHARKYIDPCLLWTAKRFISWRLTANQVTVIAFIVGVSTFFWITTGQPLVAVLFLWFSGFLDSVDGTMARLTKQTSAWGTVMDVTFDRLVELAVIIALALLYPDTLFAMLLLTGAIVVSMTVFLTVGAVSEKQSMKSFYYQAGVMERTEGFILLSIMMLFPSVLYYSTLVFAGLVFFTACQRLYEAKKILS